LTKKLIFVNCLPDEQVGFPLQSEVSVAKPAQVDPDPEGAGLSQFRVRVLFPEPQVREHDE
jgi:hypothetical protein